MNKWFALKSYVQLFQSVRRFPPKRFLLINMPGLIASYPPYAIGIINNIVRKAGWVCRVLDLNVVLFRLVSEEDRRRWNPYDTEFWYDPESTERLYQRYRNQLWSSLRAIDVQDYDIVGFSVSEAQRYFTLSACQYLKELRTEKPILFGGSDCFPSQYSNLYFSEPYGAPHAICLGEAELALAQFLKEFEASGDYRTRVRGFAYTDNGKIVDNGLPELPRLGSLGSDSDWSAIDLSAYEVQGRLPIESSRGCPNKCAFCQERPNMRRYRLKRPSSLFQEITHSVLLASENASNPTLCFHDSLINGNIDHLENMCDEMIHADSRVSWTAQAAFDNRLTRNLLRKMRLSGCRWIKGVLVAPPMY